ncbi:adhesion G-protein coupled receptor G2 [Brachyhypopomus gauderio]|uniref:adhesion G-protein coupled receptor G2 n=1 Tax=Brachyhypopomus gauderio TaxID=698409 RepID=UPI0040410827
MVGDRMSDFSGSSLSLVARSLALSVVKIDQTNFYNLTFGVSSMSNGPYPEVYVNQQVFEGTVAFISLPATLHSSLPSDSRTSPRIQFQFYGAPALFNDNQKGKTLNTYVVSASVINATEPIKDLKEPVVVTLHHLDTNILGKGVHCVYWNFNKNGGQGGWSHRGCWKYNVTTNYTTCMCDHLTHFGVLLDVSRTAIDEENERILTVITYTGCSISAFFLSITVLTYSLLKKLRRDDHPSQILLNLSIALLGLNLVFLVNSWLSSFGIYGLCVAVATAQHYFLLTSFTWMFLEAVNMYFALVKVFNVYIPSYILKFCTFGWGMPLVICCLVLVVKQDAYAAVSTGDSMNNSEMFCWIQDDVVFYVSVVGYVVLVLLCNTSVFLVVLVQIKKMHKYQPAGIHSGILKELRGVASLTLLLGLTWAVAFFTWGAAKVPLLYLFSILNSLQGFFIFVFHCLMKDNVRKQWRVHLCLGRFKLQEDSDCSHTSPVITKPKANQFPTIPMVASVRSNKSNSTQTSSASSDCSQCQVSLNNPNLGLVYQQGLVLPRAQQGPTPSAQTARFPHADGIEIHSWLPDSSYDIYFK